MTVSCRGRMLTGDLGLIDEDGYLRVTGRAKDLIIRGGVNISPLEIDSFLMQHPALIEVATVGVPDAVYGEEVVSYVVARPGAASMRPRCCAIAATGCPPSRRRSGSCSRVTAEDRARQARPPRAGGAVAPRNGG